MNHAFYDMIRVNFFYIPITKTLYQDYTGSAVRDIDCVKLYETKLI